MKRFARGFAGVMLALAAGLAASCSLGEGEGEVASAHLKAPECWDDAFDLRPDFFAAIPYRDTLLVRVQRGTDLQEVSDGIAVLIDDVPFVRDHLGEDIPVALPAGVVPPGSPVGDEAPTSGIPPLVHLALYLQKSCHNQNIILYAVRGTIRFSALFSGDPNEADAVEKFSDAEFDVLVGDPRDVPLGAPASAIPEDRLSHLTGFFRFYFERGQPGQPFP